MTILLKELQELQIEKVLKFLIANQKKIEICEIKTTGKSQNSQVVEIDIYNLASGSEFQQFFVPLVFFTKQASKQTGLSIKVLVELGAKKITIRDAVTIRNRLEQKIVIVPCVSYYRLKALQNSFLSIGEKPPKDYYLFSFPNLLENTELTFKVSGSAFNDVRKVLTIIRQLANNLDWKYDYDDYKLDNLKITDYKEYFLTKVREEH